MYESWHIQLNVVVEWSYRTYALTYEQGTKHTSTALGKECEVSSLCVPSRMNCVTSLIIAEGAPRAALLNNIVTNTRAQDCARALANLSCTSSCQTKKAIPWSSGKPSALAALE